ncbi:MAG: hypothetical protein JXA68_06050 [Ignavibacteriales bacterium]|nr:hypothetical protein [Ignavibacteriales bacterium]
MISPLFLFSGMILIIFIIMIFILMNYKKCPSDKILVVFGKVNRNRAAKCYRGGGAFIIPFLQSHKYLSLSPITIVSQIQKVLTLKNIKVDVSYKCIVGISTEPMVMDKAAERLLNLTESQIGDLAKEIIDSQLKQIISYLSIEDIKLDREKFINEIINNIDPNLNKIGLYLINFDLNDIAINLNELVGKEGIVYTTIKRMGRGKVNILVGGHSVVVDAITNDLNEITDGERVVVTKINKDNFLVVNKY